MAALHAQCFTVPRPWSASEFDTFRADPATVLTTGSGGFALGRVTGEEAELLTIAVAPTQRRQGLGRQLLASFLSACAARGAALVFLEVDAGNVPALQLYRSAGFLVAGQRRAYYRGPDGITTDALVLRRAVDPAQPER